MVDPEQPRLDQIEQARALQHDQKPRPNILLTGRRFRLKFARPGKQRAEQQLIVEQNNDEHDEDGPADRGQVLLLDRHSDVRADAGQQDRLAGDGNRLGGDHEEPAARDRHHHVPHQRRDRMRHFEPPETPPRRQMVHARGFDQLGRHSAQRLVDAERHIPGLRGKDGKDRRAFDAEKAAWKQGDKPGYGDRQKAEDRHRLQDVEQWDQDLLCLAALGGQRGIGETEDQRGDQRPGHAQHRSKRVFRQSPWVETNYQRLAHVVPRAHRQAAPTDQGQQPQHQRQRHQVPGVWAQASRPSDKGQAPALFHAPSKVRLDVRRRLPVTQPPAAAKRLLACARTGIGIAAASRRNCPWGDPSCIFRESSNSGRSSDHARS